MNLQRICEFYDITAQHDVRLIDLLQGEIDFDFLDEDDTQDEDLNHFFD
jgi:hypothetical protein